MTVTSFTNYQNVHQISLFNTISLYVNVELNDKNYILWLSDEELSDKVLGFW